MILEQDSLDKKVNDFIKDNGISQIVKDPTSIYRSQIQQIIQTSNLLIDK
jgi:hypothetical protein